MNRYNIGNECNLPPMPKMARDMSLMGKACNLAASCTRVSELVTIIHGGLFGNEICRIDDTEVQSCSIEGYIDKAQGIISGIIDDLESIKGKINP